MSQETSAFVNMDAEKRASLRHCLSAAMIFSPTWPKEPVTAEKKAHGDAMHARVLEALDEWFSLQDSKAIKQASKLFATVGTYPQQIVPTQEPKSTLEKMHRLYLAAFNLMVYLGRKGAIHADGHAADALMNCLHDLDGGEYNSDLFVDEGSIRNAVLDECKQLTEHLADSQEHCTAMTIINGLDSLKVSQNPDDIAVNKFAAAMKAKMAKQRAKGRGGWADKEDCPTERLQQMLVDHIAKGDTVDVGNFAMMLWNRGEGTAARAEQPQAQGEELRLTDDQKEWVTGNPNTNDLVEFIEDFAYRAVLLAAHPQATEGDELESEMLDAAISWCESNGIDVLEPEQLSSLVKSLYITVRDAGEAVKPVMSIPRSYGHLDANTLEQVAKQYPNEYFLKGSGVLKLITAIRELEQKASEPAGHKLVPVEPTPEIIAAAAIAVWPVASKEDIELARKAASIVLMQSDLGPEFTVEMLAATLATMAPAYRAMLAASGKGVK